MKLLRYGPLGSEKPGLLDDQGQVRDLSGHVDDIAGDVLTPEGLAKLNSERPGRHIVCTAVRDIKSPRGASWAPHTQSAQAIWTPRGL